MIKKANSFGKIKIYSGAEILLLLYTNTIPPRQAYTYKQLYVLSTTSAQIGQKRDNVNVRVTRIWHHKGRHVDGDMGKSMRKSQEGGYYLVFTLPSGHYSRNPEMLKGIKGKVISQKYEDVQRQDKPTIGYNKNIKWVGWVGSKFIKCSNKRHHATNYP